MYKYIQKSARSVTQLQMNVVSLNISWGEAKISNLARQTPSCPLKWTKDSAYKISFQVTCKATFKIHINFRVTFNQAMSTMCDWIRVHFHSSFLSYIRATDNWPRHKQPPGYPKSRGQYLYYHVQEQITKEVKLQTCTGSLSQYSKDRPDRCTLQLVATKENRKCIQNILQKTVLFEINEKRRDCPLLLIWSKHPLNEVESNRF